ncbi:CDF family Co(II)/Ni(II) efflux transporter DmeF [Rhizobiales bacterium RZME27]|jgi:cation diffusion facilitator family transporter|uniref:CDF family Co(II)/Ni(II) efflux transporter DmeF n=1 Tax=Endobacterium cereale TaxID=2663029 RepID=A0A6A8AHD3_9HYPH|nr:CDF family Co(II)/Ni(II) efflux transporter DmeF [Endobacterium cereale]MEB2847409.1 CDF family Co(II)/Ni(II) efflux transporter DmeF [Endobacterium cereale]MQY49258.1 CDF family Co(II)/Ni(II) efflux transporter DmeF [Endobacterium cereale]
MSFSPDTQEHEHVFLGADHNRNERRVWLVIALTTAMMIAEIVAGTLYGSMALLADGWHMSTHAGAMLIAAVAYLVARKQARNRQFTFGTGKLGDLAGFASAIVLGLIALLIAWESLLRLANPVAIDFGQAIMVAVLGLAVNLASAWLLKDDHSHHGDAHGHGHEAHAHDDHAEHEHGGHAKDNNLRAAYLHVLADALTSVLAIVALVLGNLYGWNWLDPIMGVVGGLVIARWSWGLVRATSGVLLDALPQAKAMSKEIRERVEMDGDRITDLHIWQVGPGHHAAIIAITARQPQSPTFYKAKLRAMAGLSHVTVEVSPQT